MILGTDFDWNSVNLGGVSVGGGLLAIAIFIGPKIPTILDWIDKQIDKKRSFAREKRKEDAELSNHLISVLQGIAVTTAQHTDSIEDIRKDLSWFLEWVR